MSGETSWGKSTIEQVPSGSRSAMPRTTAALARMCPLPMALERIKMSAFCSSPATGALYWGLRSSVQSMCARTAKRYAGRFRL
jgi:hypothetical protein